MPDSDGEMYFDKVKGVTRPRRGHRKKARGPMSAAEKRMRVAFNLLLVAVHNMDGEIADVTCDDFTAEITLMRAVCTRYAFSVIRDPIASGVDPHVVRDEMGVVPATAMPEDQDVLRDLLS